MAKEWDDQYLYNGLKRDIKQDRIEQGKPPTKKPTHKWLRKNGYRQLFRKVRERGYTPDEFLTQELGFEKEQKGFPCDDKECIRTVHTFLDIFSGAANRWNSDSTIFTKKAHIRKLMNIADNRLGTSNLLEIGRGEKAQVAFKGQQMIDAIDEENSLSTSSQGLYLTTLRQFIEYAYEIDVVDWDSISYFSEIVDWTPERTEPRAVPSKELVREHFKVCETLTEQMLMYSLSILGARPSDTEEDLNLSEMLQLNTEIPHIIYSDKRKNGPGSVPVVGDTGIIESYLSVLAEDPLNTGGFFPSRQRSCGTRSTEWIRDRIEEITNRVDMTMENGENPTPKNFRQFWYQHYLKAMTEYRKNADNVGALQGSDTTESVTTYAEREPWLKEYLRTVEHQLEDALPDNLAPSDDIGRIDIDPTRSAQVKLTGDYVSVFSVVGATGEVATKMTTNVAQLGHLLAKRKHLAMAVDPDWKNYPLGKMSHKRKTATTLTAGAILLTAVGFWYHAGILGELQNGNPITMIALLMSFSVEAYLIRRDTPTVAEAVDKQLQS